MKRNEVQRIAIARGVGAMTATMQRSPGVWRAGLAGGGRGCPRLAGGGRVRIISDCATTWQALARASHNLLCFKVLRRAAVPANPPREVGRDGGRDLYPLRPATDRMSPKLVVAQRDGGATLEDAGPCPWMQEFGNSVTWRPRS